MALQQEMPCSVNLAAIPQKRFCCLGVADILWYLLLLPLALPTLVRRDQGWSGVVLGTRRPPCVS